MLKSNLFSILLAFSSVVISADASTLPLIHSSVYDFNYNTPQYIEKEIAKNCIDGYTNNTSRQDTMANYVVNYELFKMGHNCIFVEPRTNYYSLNIKVHTNLHSDVKYANGFLNWNTAKNDARLQNIIINVQIYNPKADFKNIYSYPYESGSYIYSTSLDNNPCLDGEAPYYFIRKYNFKNTPDDDRPFDTYNNVTYDPSYNFYDLYSYREALAENKYDMIMSYEDTMIYSNLDNSGRFDKTDSKLYGNSFTDINSYKTITFSTNTLPKLIKINISSICAVGTSTPFDELELKSFSGTYEIKL